jgi:small-conductance mechanosensitive channel
VLRGVRLEQLAQRGGVTAALQGLGVRAPISEILAQIVFFFLILSFATSAMQLMSLTTVATLLQNVLAFVPRAISGALIVIFGSMLARFLGGTITSVAHSVNITYANALGKIIEYAIVAFVVVLAISTLGVDTTILTTSLTIIIASTGLALALTFAFGARDSAHNVIAGYYVRQAFQPGQRLTYGSYTGIVRSTFGTYTVLDVTSEAGEQSTLSLPNALLLKDAIVSSENTPPAATSNQPTGNPL